MDAGCEISGYTSDVTRVWPTSGKFSLAQKLVYEAVLDVQTRCPFYKLYFNNLMIGLTEISTILAFKKLDNDS